MNKSFIKIASLLGALAVVLGAFGAHALKKILSDAYLATFETGVKYQLYHVFALLAVGILYKEFTNKWVLLSGRLFCLGIFIFCGSLYLLTLMRGLQINGFEWLGAITPLGGISLIAGWICLFVGIEKKN